MEDRMDTIDEGGGLSKTGEEDVPASSQQSGDTSAGMDTSDVQQEQLCQELQEEKQKEESSQGGTTSVSKPKPPKQCFKDHYKACAEVTTRFFSYIDTLQQATFSRDGQRLYFIAAVETRPMGLYCVTVGGNQSAEAESGPSAWKLVSEPMIRGEPPPSKAQEYRNERRRKVFLGILGYEDGWVKAQKYALQPQSMLWVYEPFLLKLLTLAPNGSHSLLCPPIHLPPNLDFLDHKVCPYDGNLIAAICKEELFVLEMGYNPDIPQPLGGRRLTTVTDDKKKHLSAGSPSFCTMEEFERYTGFWWQPKEGFDGKIYKILFEENDESRVMNQYTFNPNTSSVNGYKYPDAGTDNSRSLPKLLEFWYEKPMGKGEEEISKFLKTLPYDLQDLMPECEYMVRCGWLPNGQWVYLQLLNRSQTELRLVILPTTVFCDTDTDLGESPVDSPPTVIPFGFVLLQEVSDSWVNVNDVFEVVHFDKDSVRFIWLSEASGFNHLELVESVLTPPEAVIFNTYLYQAKSSRKPITSGPWVVMPTQVWVDQERQLVYFHGNRETPLEQHLYAVSYKEVESETPPPPTLLTSPGCNHTTQMNESCTVFYDTWSSIDEPAVHSVYSITHHAGQPQAKLSRHLTNHRVAKQDLPPHRLFTCPASTGETLYGVLYHPKVLEPGRKHPTIVYVYGGPRFQLVKNSFPYALRYAMQWTQAGFCVLMLDNRGAFYRGKAFEQHIQDLMGQIEVEDQVAGLLYIAKETGIVDLERVGVTGWSYGGYMSLMCLAKRPDIFKVAISGAPVTLWLHYDTGYTERYLGQVHGDGKPYLNSSVLKYVDQFPDEPNRLLLIHGTDDDNVYLRHTTLLTAALNKAGKPYDTKIYTGEKHGVRSSQNTKHLDAVLLSYFVQGLQQQQ